MGHSTDHTTLIYLHSTSARQHHLADAVTARAQSELGKTDQPSGGGVARMWHEVQEDHGQCVLTGLSLGL